MSGVNIEEGATDDDRPPRARARKVPVAELLKQAFGSPLPVQEASMWALMSPAQQGSAVQRVRTLLLFDDPDTAPSVERAAADAGVSLNRWYEMHRDWRERRSLASVGTFAALPGTRTQSHHADLQKLVVGVVDSDPKGSVRQLALALGEALGTELGIEPEKRPSYNTLRKFAEDEVRRRNREGAPGNEIMLDCCACTLPHADGTFIAFLVLDRGSHAVLGAALGSVADSRTGYAQAARDALGRLRRMPLTDLHWVERVERSEIVLGADDADWSKTRKAMADSGLARHLQLATSRRRFGMYVRRLLGDRIGRIRFLPGRTTSGEGHAAPTKDDVARLGAEIDLHNADLPLVAVADEARPPSADLIALLELVAEASADGRS